MNKTVNFRGTMHMVLLCVLAAMLPALNSCKEDSVNTADLLSTVPSSAGAVAGFNMKAVLEKAGCKVDGSQIEPGEEVASLIQGGASSLSKTREMVNILLNGESGIDPAGAIFFMDAYTGYVTLALADTNKFKAFMEKENGSTFQDAGNGVAVCGNVAVKGAQAWISTGEGIDPKAVANYSALSSEQSFMSKEFSRNIATMTHDIVGWGEISKLGGRGMGFGEVSTMRLMMGMLFNDANSISFSVDFLEGKATATTTILNKDGKPAEYLLPADKVDLSTVKSIAKNANLIGAFCVTEELVKKIDNMLSSFGGDGMRQMSESLKSLDGTAAVAVGDLNNFENSVSGVVTTKGEAGLNLLQLISSIAPTTKDGKLIRFSNGNVGGDLEVEKAADYLKGATFGVVVNLQSPSLNKGDLEFTTCALSFVPKDGGIDCNVTLVGKDQKKNILLSVIESFAK